MKRIDMPSNSARSVKDKVFDVISSEANSIIFVSIRVFTAVGGDKVRFHGSHCLPLCMELVDNPEFRRKVMKFLGNPL